ncbi:hypothetical protein ALC56_03112 [Trachymyrmex septentrionalis]|uniref:CCHC-type domain-containing protein n=1 Tax=Trachymyrmex septentrionalis TaxID=34720 RepID=A0A151JZX6_9HYME|nr:hypothetical protein ALC56_03112 [Trachymyrmex septentrionalis]
MDNGSLMDSWFIFKEALIKRFRRQISYTSCAYCKAKGHVKADCWKLKRKENSSQNTSTSNTVTARETTETERSGNSFSGRSNHDQLAPPVGERGKV